MPALDWSVTKVTEADFPPEALAKHGIDYCRRAGVLAFKGGGKDSPARIGTPLPFRDLLIAMAQGVTN